jgi:hypothetical protein
MDVRQLFKLLLAVLLTAGLTIAPLATVAAGGHSMPAAMPMVDMADMPDMAADMQCCPHEQESKDCQDCPLLEICLAKSTQINPAATALILDRTAIDTVLLATDDAIADGLERPPPDHPPRILV